MRKTKIVCTIGPTSETVELLVQLIENGMDVARLNFSHGTHEEHAKRIASIRQAAQITEKEIAIILDTKGPEIRLGKMEGGKRVLKEGDKIILTGEQVFGTLERVSISYPNLADEINPGQLIMVNDGLVTLEVEKIDGNDIYCITKNTGEIADNKGVNIPNVKIKLPALSEKDKGDIIFAIENEVDFIAASFIRCASDVIEIRKILECYQSDINIIAKIENSEGVDNIESILKVADGVMVARGDLGVQIETEDVPLVQKRIIRTCNAIGKPVITATQMLDSMIRNPRPTRAEASDVANAILDGTDAIMLSGETASGKYPLLAVQMMAKIALRTEEALKYGPRSTEPIMDEPTITDAISHASFTMADDLKATAIITPTTSGSTPRMVSKYRPRQTIVGTTQSKKVIRRLALVWGVYGIEVKCTMGTDEMFAEAVLKALDKKLISAGDLVIITAGMPADVPGTTNLIKVHVAGEIALKGTGIGRKVVTGRALVVDSIEQAGREIKEGDVVVLVAVHRDIMPIVSKAAAIITEEGGLTSSGAIVAINLGIQAIVGAENATTVFKTGETITVDAQRGLIYRGKVKVL